MAEFECKVGASANSVLGGNFLLPLEECAKKLTMGTRVPHFVDCRDDFGALHGEPTVCHVVDNSEMRCADGTDYFQAVDASSCRDALALINPEKSCSVTGIMKRFLAFPSLWHHVSCR